MYVAFAMVVVVVVLLLLLLVMVAGRDTGGCGDKSVSDGCYFLNCTRSSTNHNCYRPLWTYGPSEMHFSYLNI